MYILTEEELNALVPVGKLHEALLAVDFLAAKLMDATRSSCIHATGSKRTGYCDYCPLAGLPSPGRTEQEMRAYALLCRKPKNFSK